MKSTNNIKHIYLAGILMIYLINAIVAQSTSFQMRMDTFLISIDYNDIIVNDQDEILLLMDGSSGFLPHDYFIIPINSAQNNSIGLKLSYPISTPSLYINSIYAESKILLATSQGGFGAPTIPVLSSIDLNTSANWSKKTRGASLLLNYDLDANDYVILASGVRVTNPPFYTQKFVLELHKIDQGGTTIWKQGLAFGVAGFPEGNMLSVSKVVAYNANETYILGHFAKGNPTNQGPQFILKLDSIGNPVKWRTIKNMQLHEMLVTNDGIYVWDKSPSLSLNYDVSSYDFDQSSTRLVKLDFDLNLIWAKRYSAENFQYLSASVVETNSGNLVMAHTTYGNFPVVLTDLDADGNIISQKGYPNYQPIILALKNGGLLLGSPLVENSNTRFNPIIAKTDVDGNIEGCPTLPTCMSVEPTNVTFGTFSIDTISIAELEDLPPLGISNFSVTFQPYCDYPPAPEPSFSFPDTLCYGDTASTSSSDGNRMAQAREWQLLGPGIDTLVRDSFEFSYHFEVPGDYLLRQTVWVLGCASSYEHVFTVLSPLELSIVSDSLICPGEPLEMRVEANRQALFNWVSPTGIESQGEVVSISQSGTYHVVASDGYCGVSDSATVTVAGELLGNNPPFTLPNDTVTCMPFELEPSSIFTNQFFLNESTTPAARFNLDKSGTYRISMMAFGCVCSKEFKYGVDCHVDIYLPTSFSPNGDGLNDVFKAYGEGFEVVELSIYGRWGSLYHRGLDWDGGAAGPGVYPYQLKYKNLKSGEFNEMRGEVTLVK